MRVRIWFEDREHETFIRALLQEAGLDRRSVDINVAPSGKGAASQWVLKQYESVQKQARTSKHQTQLGFIVLVDGDSVGLEGRMKQLHPNKDRDSQDRIAILVPTWEIETWVLWLAGSSVDEDKSYKLNLNSQRFRELLPAALSVWAKPRDGESSSVPSLERGREELKRLPASI